MKRLCSAIITAAVVFLSLPVFGCSDKDENDYYFLSVPSYSEYISSSSTAFVGDGSIMGSDISLVISTADNFSSESEYSSALSLWKDVKELLISADSSLSLSYESSYISRFNAAAAGERLELDECAYEVLSLSLQYYDKTEGYFNPAVYPCSLLYGFSSGSYIEPETLPESDTLTALVELSSAFGDIELYEENGAYYAVKPQKTVTAGGKEYCLQIDLGGIGKGWCADKISALVSSYGFEYGYFSFGTSTIAINKYIGNDSGEYTVGSRDPRASGNYITFTASNAFLSTSGDYEQYYEKDGVRYCHIINPFTGSPIQTGIASATVISQSCAEADALTTALSCMGSENAQSFMAENYPASFYVMLRIDGETGEIITSDKSRVTIANSNYAFK